MEPSAAVDVLASRELECVIVRCKYQVACRERSAELGVVLQSGSIAEEIKRVTADRGIVPAKSDLCEMGLYARRETEGLGSRFEEGPPGIRRRISWAVVLAAPVVLAGSWRGGDLLARPRLPFGGSLAPPCGVTSALGIRPCGLCSWHRAWARTRVGDAGNIGRRLFVIDVAGEMRNQFSQTAFRQRRQAIRIKGPQNVLKLPASSSESNSRDLRRH